MKKATTAAFLSISCSIALAAPKSGSEAKPARAKEGQSVTSPVKLLWVKSKYNGPAKDNLVESEKLTVAEYRKRGVEVVELQQADLEKWREGPGKDYVKAGKYMQYIAYARTMGANAVGGLNVFELNDEMAEGTDKKPGDYIHGWGIALDGVESNMMFNLDGGSDPRAVPMHLVESDPWAIPMRVEPQSCESGSKEPDFLALMSKGRPFLGVMLEDRTINTVIPGSPAEQAGLAKGDLLLSVAGREINGLGELASVMGEQKAGDAVPIEFEHNGKREKKTITLADRSEVTATNNPEGKPLPALTGKDIHGKEVRLADFKGKVVILEFWATWCGPCVEEMPLMQLTWDKLKDKGLVWIGVSADEEDEIWRGFVTNNRLGGIHLRSPEWGVTLAVDSFPTVYLVDRSGIVRCKVRGGSIAQAAAALLQ